MNSKYNMTLEDNIFFAKRKLVDYYETDNSAEVKKFLYENCIDGVE